MNFRAKEQAEKTFNEKKANHLETIVEQGKRENARIEELKEIIEREQRKKEKYQEEIESSADRY
ncbi:hypothetical protein [Bacillus niameyensis]|uniref:hypothetical protein n=1 Tax=Bacillus niameyensis TaxID=1522308 RepID=UPI0007843630|nr:hypothetical protein [Bacillus niameyensis]